MGINRDFNYGIKLYTFSFAFSNLNNLIKEEIDDNYHLKDNFKFLSTFTREMFNHTKKIKNKARQYAGVFNIF